MAEVPKALIKLYLPGVESIKIWLILLRLLICSQLFSCIIQLQFRVAMGSTVERSARQLLMQTFPQLETFPHPTPAGRQQLRRIGRHGEHVPNQAMPQGLQTQGSPALVVLLINRQELRKTSKQKSSPILCSF